METRNGMGRNLVQAGVFLLWPGTSQSCPENHSFLKSFRGESELTKYIYKIKRKQVFKWWGWKGIGSLPVTGGKGSLQAPSWLVGAVQIAVLGSVLRHYLVLGYYLK